MSFTTFLKYGIKYTPFAIIPCNHVVCVSRCRWSLRRTARPRETETTYRSATCTAETSRTRMASSSWNCPSVTCARCTTRSLAYPRRSRPGWCTTTTRSRTTTTRRPEMRSSTSMARRRPGGPSASWRRLTSLSEDSTGTWRCTRTASKTYRVSARFFFHLLVNFILTIGDNKSPILCLSLEIYHRW